MKTKTLSILTGVVALLFCAVYLHSAEQKGTPAEITQHLYVPETYGTVEEVFQGKDKRLVIHIQDAHTDGKAQENIAAILDKLLINYNIDSIWIEGGSGVIDTSLFASFPAEKTKESLSRLYMNEGMVSGPEYFSINAKKFVHLFGAEDMQLYLDNVKAFKDVWTDHQNVKTAIESMRESIQLLKNQVYPAALKEIDGKKTSFEKGELTFSAYCLFLKEACEKQGIDTKQFSDFNQLFAMFTAEKGIDFDKIEPERIALIEQLAGKLNREKLTQLTQNSLLFRVGRMTPIAFYGSLKMFADGEKIALGKNLEAYITYLSVSKIVDRVKANSDREAIEDALYAKLCGTVEAKSVSALSKDFRVMEKMLTLRLSRKDLDFYLKNKEACSPATLEGGLKENLLKSGLNAAAMSTSLLTPAVDTATKFYDVALKRDDQLVKNLLDGMTAVGKDKAILVSGGFHTDGIKRMLREKGISYVVILPKVSPVYNETKYASLMLDEETPYLDFFKKRKAPDALPGSIGMAAVHERAEAVLATETRFGNDARGQDFTLEILSVLPSLAVGVEQAQPADLIAGWLKNLQERIAAALDIEKGVFKADVGAIEGVKTIYPPLKLSDNELYVPVRIGDRTLVLKVYRGAEYKPLAGLVGASCPVKIADVAYTVQACDEAGFIDSILKANVLLTNAAAPAYLNSLGADVKNEMASSVSGNVAKVENEIFKEKFPTVKDPTRTKVLVYDLDQYETMVGLSEHLKSLKADKNVKVVLVTKYPDIKKILDTLLLAKDVQYDEVVQAAEGEGNVIDKVMGTVETAFPAIKAQDEYNKKDVVIVTPNAKRFGPVDQNAIKGTPVITPNIRPADDEIVSVKQILLYAKLVLVNDGNIGVLVSAILKEPSDYPELKNFLTAQGITTESAVQDLIYNPAPVKVPTGSTIGTEVRGYIEYLKAA